MADFPTIDFEPYQWATLDRNYIVKWNGMQVSLNSLQANIAAFGAEVTTEKKAAAESAQAAGESAQEALEYRNQAKAIAVGDVSVTDLQPGALTAEKDYVSVDEEGELVKRNLSDDVSEQLSSGEESIKAGRIDYASAATTTVLDLAAAQAFHVDASNPVTLTFENQAAVGRVAVIPITITGNSAVTWMPELSDPDAWDEGAVPELGDIKTKVVAEFDGIEWSGFVRVAK